MRVTATDKTLDRTAVSSGQSARSPEKPARKVFFLVDSFNIGGTETQAVELALRMTQIGHNVTLGCLRREGPLLERVDGSEVTVREFHPAGGIDSVGGIYQLLRLSWFLRREKFEVVHTHDLWSNLLGVPAARMAGVPVIVSSRRDLSNFDWYRGSRRKWLRRIQNLSGAVLANALSIREALVVEDGFAPEKVRVIYNGIDIAKFQHNPSARERLFPGTGECKLVVLVGNMHTDVKGHPWLIDCAPAVLKEFPEVRFVFAGDGERKVDFEQQIAKLSVESKFVFMGRRQDIPEILACCDIGVLPSRAEGMSNALLEYMAAQLPVIASRVGGNPELVEDGITGLLVPPENADALADAVLKLLRDPQLARRVALNGHEFVTQNFSFERLARDVDAMYSELLQRHRGIA